MLALVAIIIIALCNLGLGLVVLLKNRGSLTNITFSIFAFMLAAWLLITFYSNDVALNHALQLWLNRVTIFIPGVALYFLLLFSLLFTRKGDKYFRSFAMLLGLISLVVSVIATTPLVISSIYPRDNIVAIKYGTLTPLFFIFIVAEFIAIIAILTMSVGRLSGAAKARTQIMAGSIFLALVVTVITNLVLPVAFNNYRYVPLGLVSTIIIVGGFTYAIIKHRLFDIRSVVARSVAYFLLLSLIHI